MSTAPDTAARSGDAAMDADGMGPLLEWLCPKCDYHLRGISGDRCPECGLEVDRILGDAHAVPWIHRRDIGRLRAFWSTVIMVMFRSRWLRCDLHRPAKWSDGQRFRLVVSFHALIALICLAGALLFVSGSYRDLSNFAEEVGWWFLGVCVAATWLSILLITGTPAYFFHPKRLDVEIKNRAVALSSYACASLAWMPLMPVISFLYHAFIGGESDLQLTIWTIGFIWPPVLLFLFWADTLRLARRLTDRPIGAMARMAVLLPLIWLAIVLFIAVLIPVLIAYAVLMIGSIWSLISS